MKTLIVYFSWSGNTEKIARTLAVKTGGTLFRLERRIPYSTDYNTCAYTEAKEEHDKVILPELKTPLPDVMAYDRVILAFPIWWYTFPMVVASFLSSVTDWKGKRIDVFANSYTDDPQYMVTSLQDVKHYAKNADVQRGLFNKEIRQLDEWVKENGVEVNA